MAQLRALGVGDIKLDKCIQNGSNARDLVGDSRREKGQKKTAILPPFCPGRLKTEQELIYQSMNSFIFGKSVHKTNMRKLKPLIEECTILETGFIKQDLKCCRNKEAKITGVFNIVHGNQKLLCDYWIEYAGNNAYFVISTGVNFLPQRILLSEQPLYFGIRSYFVCNCGRRASKLFLPSGQNEFKCRKCHHLRYELSTINRNSVHGELFYRTNRTIKLANQQADMNRIIYKKRYTKRFNSFLKLCEQAGFNTVVRDARDLMTAIKAQ